MDKRAIQAAGFIDLSGEKVNLHEGEVLVVCGDRIEGFIPADSLPAHIEIEDHSSQFCLPGLIDTAFMPGLMMFDEGFAAVGYGEMVWNARKAVDTWLGSGVTTAGTLGAADRLDLDLQASIQDGRIKGPRLIPALHPLVPIGAGQFSYSYGVQEVNGPEAARKAARELIKNGAERITIYADVPLRFSDDPVETSRERFCFSVEEISEIVTQASQANCFVHAQAISTQAIENCAKAGVRSIGCAFGLKESQLSLLRDRHVALAPNLALGTSVKEFGQSAGLSAGAIQMVSRQRISPEMLTKAYQMGVEVVCGTNAAFPQGDVVQECKLLKAAGIPVEGVLRAATKTAAETLKPYCEWGDFSVNYYSDFIFLEGNPLQELGFLNEPVEIRIDQ